MRLQSTVAVALVVALASMASASVVTLDIIVANTNLSLDGSNGPTSTTYDVYAVVTQNTWYNSANLAAGPYYFGLKGWGTSLGFTSTNGGVLRSQVDLVTVSDDGTWALGTANSIWTQSLSSGRMIGTAGTTTPVAYGTGGIYLTSGAKANPSGTGWKTAPAPYMAGNGDSGAAGPGGSAGPGRVLLYSGAIDAVAAGDITIAASLVSSTTRLFGLTGGTYPNGTTISGAVVPTTLVGDTQVIHVAAPVPQTTPPTVDITTADVTEAAWTDQPGWNNPLHSVQINAVGSAGTTEGDAAQTLTWLWQVTNNNGVTKNLAATGSSFSLTIGELASLFASDGGLPGPYASGTDHAADPAYNWTLKATVSDGVDSPNAVDTMKIFVPEPATMSLLAFGIVGAIMRRRRA